MGRRKAAAGEWEHARAAALAMCGFRGAMTSPTIPPISLQYLAGPVPAGEQRGDGHAGTAPAQSFEPNGFGSTTCRQCLGMDGRAVLYPLAEETFRAAEGDGGISASKGGSFLCHRSHCYRYRIAARSGISRPDPTAAHQGFRVVWDV